MNEDVVNKIKEMISSQKVFLFMKGTPDQPMCGFSAQVVNVLGHFGTEFGSYNILENEDVRETLKEYAQWPTFPQLWINGELVGGCDIVMELAHNGELDKLLNA